MNTLTLRWAREEIKRLSFRKQQLWNIIQLGGGDQGGNSNPLPNPLQLWWQAPLARRRDGRHGRGFPAVYLHGCPQVLALARSANTQTACPAQADQLLKSTSTSPIPRHVSTPGTPNPQSSVQAALYGQVVLILHETVFLFSGGGIHTPAPAPHTPHEVNLNSCMVLSVPVKRLRKSDATP